MTSTDASIDSCTLLKVIVEHHDLTAEAITLREARARFPAARGIQRLAHELEILGKIEIEVEAARCVRPGRPSPVLTEDQIWLMPTLLES